MWPNFCYPTVLSLFHCTFNTILQCMMGHVSKKLVLHSTWKIGISHSLFDTLNTSNINIAIITSHKFWYLFFSCLTYNFAHSVLYSIHLILPADSLHEVRIIYLYNHLNLSSDSQDAPSHLLNISKSTLL